MKKSEFFLRKFFKVGTKYFANFYVGVLRWDKNGKQLFTMFLGSL